MAIIGETLAVPEYGFTRYEFINKDDLTLNNEYFYSIGTFITQDANGLLAVGVSNGDEILVKIKNTYNFRLLVCLPSSTNANTLYTNNMVVEIDGTKHTFDLTSNRNTTIIDNCLAVDIKDLSTNSHIVKIYADGNNNDTQMINVQAIDIDTKGVVGFTRTMASMFEGCTNLKKDIIIPKNADVVENMFKNCTSMTHVHSNWDETYDDSGINTEDCYSGCTSITHIDDVALSLNEYTNGLDSIPSEWGGYGFSKEYTGIYMVEILSPNYTFSFASDGLLDNGYINWGDGTTTKNEYSHTYVNAGVYIIKGKVHSTYETATDSMKLCLKEILQYPIYGNLANAFIGCTALVSANISGNKYYNIKGRAGVFLNCTNLERVIALDTKLEKGFSHISAFQSCKKLREIIGLEDFIYNTLNLMNCFSYCPSLPNFTLSEDCLKNCTSLYQAFSGCTSLTESPIKTFVSNSDSLSIGRMFLDCTNLTDISGVTFGENITNADNWYPPNLITANNITIKNDYVKFTNKTTLTACNNLKITSDVTKLTDLFSGCNSLVDVGFSEDSDVSNVRNIQSLFKGCSKVVDVEMPPFDYDNMENMWYVFSGCSSLINTPIRRLTSSCYMIYTNCASLTKISDVYFGFNDETSPVNMFLYCNSLKTIENCTIATEKFNAKTMWLANTLEEIKKIEFEVVNLSNMFEDCVKLKNDIIIPSRVTDCSNMFKGCTAMTHIHSNWNNNYIVGITATDCYSGCTAITHIDDKNVIAYEGDTGIDYVPSEWGGNGFTKSNTSILRINLTSDNYNVCISTITPNDGVTSWGDGTADTSMEHTYSTAGTYILKTQKLINTVSGKVTLRGVLIDILGLSNKNDSEGHVFRDCGKLKTVNMDDYILKNKVGVPFFQGSPNVKYISAKNVTIKNSGFSCLPNGSSLKRTNNVLTEIVGIDTWKIETNDLSYLFKGYAKLESLDISNWDLKNVTNMSNMFEWCESLTESPIKNFPSSVTDVSYMFKDCISLTHDIEIPSHITNCSNMFKDCTSMTHIRSNWNNSYNYEIIPTDCYSGCTAITHIDDKNVMAYEGDTGIDYVPSEWGGNGFTKSDTSVLRINLTSDNYNVCISWIDQTDGVTSWGDGTTDGSMAHTYSTAGTYILKTQKVIDTTAPKATLREVLTDILGLSNSPLGGGGNSPHHFRRCEKLKTVNMDDYILKSPSHTPLFYDSYNVEYISAKNVTIKNSGFGCTTASYVKNYGNNILTEIVGVDTWKIETNDLNSLFAGFYKLKSLNISNWNLENVTNMSNMFDCCKSLTDFSFMKSWDLSSVTSFNAVFADSGISEFSGCVANNITGYINENFQRCSNVTKVSYEGMNLINVTGNLYIGFTSCSSLKEVSFKNTNLQFTSALFMFERCDLLETIDFTSCHFNYNSHSDSYNFGLTNSVKNIIFSENSFEGSPTVIINSTSLTVDSLLSLFNALVTISDSRTLKIGSANLAKLSSEQIKIATDKGWTVV